MSGAPGLEILGTGGAISAAGEQGCTDGKECTHHESLGGALLEHGENFRGANRIDGRAPNNAGLRIHIVRIPLAHHHEPRRALARFLKFQDPRHFKHLLRFPKGAPGRSCDQKFIVLYKSTTTPGGPSAGRPERSKMYPLYLKPFKPKVAESRTFRLRYDLRRFS